MLEPTQIDPDSDGFGYRRGELIAMDLDPAALAAAEDLGFVLVRDFDLPSVGAHVFLLRSNRALATPEAIRLLASVAPSTPVAPNHVFLAPTSEGRAQPVSHAQAPQRACDCNIAMLDTAVEAGHPAFEGVHVRQRAFASPQASASAHGTEVASLMFGHGTSGAHLYVADVFSGERSRAGAATVVIEALEWIASTGAPVVNVSLAGPQNPVVDAVIARMTQHGVVVVAAVGNDGPAAPPAFPAAMPGVVAVTAVDSQRQIYRYAIRGDHVALAAPGVGVIAAGDGAGYVQVTGTSFAAPQVAAEVARHMNRPDRAQAAATVQHLEETALDLGPRGRDRIYGFGLLSDERP